MRTEIVCERKKDLSKCSTCRKGEGCVKVVDFAETCTRESGPRETRKRERNLAKFMLDIFNPRCT